MSLLSPWFLAGLALVAGPIIAHLIRRATRDRVAFSAVRFLSPSAPRLDRRSRIQHPLLLALRMLILALLALAFARPYFETDSPLAPAITPPRHLIAVVDTSASMQRDGLWSQAQERVRALVNQLNEQDDFTLLFAGTTVRPALTAETWRERARSEHSGLLDAALGSAPQPGWSAFHLDQAVRVALETHQELSGRLDDAPPPPVIHLISDFAAGSRVSGLAGLAWPAGASVTLDRLEAATDNNIALQWLGWSTAPDGENASAIRLRLLASAKTPTTAVGLQLFDTTANAPIGEVLNQVVARGAAATVLLPVPADSPPAMSVRLVGDGVDFDNRLWITRPSPRDLPIVLLGAESSNNSTTAAYYLQRAIVGWRDPVPQIAPSLPPLESTGLPPLIIATGDADWSRTPRLEAWIDRGATLLVLANKSPDIQAASSLLGETGWNVSQVTSGSTSGHALLGKIDFAHPLFLPFADPRYSDFSRIRFWSHPRIELPARSTAQIVARYDDDSPAVIEARIEKGRIVIWAGDWTPQVSQWVLSSKFVPWLQALAEQTAGGPLRASITGLDQMDRLGSYDALTPMGSSAPAERTPGLYQLVRDGFPLRTVALNVPEIESELAPLDLDVFTQLGVPLEQPDNASSISSTERRNEAAQLAESRLPLWRWFLIAAAVFLALESLLSLRIARRSGAPA